MTEPIDGCPTLEDLAALAEGRLHGAERERVVAHVASCDGCREVFAATLGSGEGVGTAGVVAAREEERAWTRNGSASRRRSVYGAWAAAATLVLVGTIVAYQMNARRSPPSRAEWLAQMPPAKELIPDLWGGVVMRGGGGEGGEIARQSTEIGALLVDLEVALAAKDAERTRELARRLTTIMGEAGLLDDDAEALRQAIEKPSDGRMQTLPRVLPPIERALRARFLPFYLDLGAFAEQARLAALQGDTSFLTSGRVQRYLGWLVSQREERLSDATLEALVELRGHAKGPRRQADAANRVLRSLAL